MDYKLTVLRVSISGLLLATATIANSAQAYPWSSHGENISPNTIYNPPTRYSGDYAQFPIANPPGDSLEVPGLEVPPLAVVASRLNDQDADLQELRDYRRDPNRIESETVPAWLQASRLNDQDATLQELKDYLGGDGSSVPTGNTWHEIDLYHNWENLYGSNLNDRDRDRQEKKDEVIRTGVLTMAGKQIKTDETKIATPTGNGWSQDANGRYRLNGRFAGNPQNPFVDAGIEIDRSGQSWYE